MQSLFELELAGCNEVTEAGLWSCLTPRIVSLSLADCINIADEAVGAVAQLLPSLYEFSLQVSRILSIWVAKHHSFLQNTIQFCETSFNFCETPLSLMRKIIEFSFIIGLPCYGCCTRLFFSKTKSQFKYTALAILLGADEPRHCKYRWVNVTGLPCWKAFF